MEKPDAGIPTVPVAPEAPVPAASDAAPADRLAAMRAEAESVRERRAAAAPASVRAGRPHPQNRPKIAPPPRPPRAPQPEPKPEPEPQPEPEKPREKRRRGHGRDRFVRRLIWIAVVLLLLIVLVLLLLPRIDRALDTFQPNVEVTVPESIAGLLPDEEMGYAKVDFTNAILGESRERKELVVMEQDVDVTSKISQNLLNLPVFSKVKIIRSHGMGVYTVALDGMTADDVSVDHETKLITITIPHTVLSYVNVDVDKTEFEDTQRAWLAIGEIKLTAEQKQQVDESIDEALDARLNDPALFTKADEIALNKVREVFQPVVAGLSNDYIVKVVMRQPAQ